MSYPRGICVQAAFDGVNDTSDICLLFHKAEPVGESDGADYIPCEPVQPYSKIEVLTLLLLHFLFKDFNTNVNHWLKLLHRGHCVRTSNRSN